MKIITVIVELYAYIHDKVVGHLELLSPLLLPSKKDYNCILRKFRIVKIQRPEVL